MTVLGEDRDDNNKDILRGGWLTLNRGCNMRCTHCYQKGTNFSPEKDMDIELAKKLIDILIASGAKNVILIGGEPTIYKHLVCVIERLVGGGIKPVLITNGRELANLSMLRKIKVAGLINVNVSIKAADEQGYQEVTKTSGSFLLMKQSIKNIMEEGLSLGVSVTMEEYFIRNIEKYLDMLLGLGVPHINFDMGSPVLLDSSVEVKGIPDPVELATAVGMIYKRMKDLEQSYGFYVTIPLCLLGQSVKDDLIKSKRITTSCHVSRGTSVVFTEDGTVTPCNHFTGRGMGKYGKDFSDKDSFLMFWKNEDLKSFRKYFNSYPHENCSHCLDWDICGGGCKIKWMYYDPKEFIGKEVRGYE